MAMGATQVSGFSSRANGIDGNENQEDEDGLEGGTDRNTLEDEKWPKYPLFIIILGG